MGFSVSGGRAPMHAPGPQRVYKGCPCTSSHKTHHTSRSWDSPGEQLPTRKKWLSSQRLLVLRQLPSLALYLPNPSSDWVLVQPWVASFPLTSEHMKFRNSMQA